MTLTVALNDRSDVVTECNSAESSCSARGVVDTTEARIKSDGGCDCREKRKRGASCHVPHDTQLDEEGKSPWPRIGLSSNNGDEEVVVVGILLL